MIVMYFAYSKIPICDALKFRDAPSEIPILIFLDGITHLSEALLKEISATRLGFAPGVQDA